MRDFTRIRPVVAAVLAAVLAAGCGAEIKDVVREPDFDATRLDGSRIAVGGVSSALSPMTPEERASMAESMFRAFLVVRPDLVVWPVENLVDVLGDEGQAALLGETRLSHRLPPERAREIGAAMPGVAYLAMARIERDEVERPSTRGLGDADTPEPGSYQNTLHLEMKAKRTLALTLTLYDLSDGRAVWIGSAVDTKTNSYGYAESTQGTTPPDLAGSLDAAQATPKARDESRAAPDVVEMVQDLCAELVGRLPGAPGGD